MELSPEFGSMNGLHWVGVALAMVSAGVHLVLGVEFFPHWMGVAFFVATGGFVAGSWLVIANEKRPTVYLLGILFTAGQIAAWIALTRPELLVAPDLAALGTAEVVDKVAQVLLIGVLVVLYRLERPEPN